MAEKMALTQFLSPKANLRVDEFGENPAKCMKTIVQIIQGIRKATHPGFRVDVKSRSVDVAVQGDRS